MSTGCQRGRERRVQGAWLPAVLQQQIHCASHRSKAVAQAFAGLGNGYIVPQCLIDQRLSDGDNIVETVAKLGLDQIAILRRKRGYV